MSFSDMGEGERLYIFAENLPNQPFNFVHLKQWVEEKIKISVFCEVPRHPETKENLKIGYMRCDSKDHLEKVLTLNYYYLSLLLFGVYLLPERFPWPLFSAV